MALTRPGKSTPKPTVVVDNLWVRYQAFASGRPVKGSVRKRILRQGGVRQVEAVRGVSFVVHEGESVGVIGHNGSGKTSMLQAVAGLIPAAEGAVYASSRPALLGVNSVLLNDLSGEKNVILGGLALGFTRNEIDAKAQEIIDFSGLQEFIDYPMRTYSSGMSARLRFSVAISRTHSIMMVDEALAVGDKSFRERSEARMREMCANAGTVFLVSHSMDSIRATCTRVLWIHRGELRMDGDPDTVIAAYEESQSAPQG